MSELTGPDKKLLKITRDNRVDTTVPSPCIDVCKYSTYNTLTNEKYCIGCFRSKEELIYWWGWHAPRKLQALADIKERKQNVKNR